MMRGGRSRRFLGEVDAERDGPSVDRGDRGHRGPAVPGDPAALDRYRHRGGRSSSRRAATCGSATNSRPEELGGGTDPVQIVAEFERRCARPRRGRARSSRELEVDARGQLGLAARLRRRKRPLPGDADRAERVRRRPGAGRAAPRHASSRRAALAEVATVDVGGETARSDDVRAQISGSMWKIVLFVLALSFLVLMVMLRSLLLPLKAVLMNLLSIGAAFGVLVAIFQWGWFDSLLGFESQGALDTINVPLIFAIVFGLSMDYEVFLMSRIRERYMAAPGQRTGGRRRPLDQRPHDLLGGADHDLRLRRLRPHRRPLDQGAGPRLRASRSPSTRPWCG